MALSEDLNEISFHYSSVKLIGGERLVAAPLGRGIELKDSLTSSWETANEGLPEPVHVNRLQSHNDRVFACTNQGLYRLDDRHWTATGLCVGTFQYRRYGTIEMAGTVSGLWFSEGEEWRVMMRADMVVYDFLYLPQFVILCTHEGLAIFDRLTSGWMRYNGRAAVTSIAVYHRTIVGATEKGELLVGNAGGGFERYRMGGMFIFSIVAKDDSVYACTDRGLYRVSRVGNRISLMAVKIGMQVTDIYCCGEQLYLATLFDGIQCMERP